MNIIFSNAIMKSRLIIIIGMIALPLIVPEGFSQCIYNDDWPPAPCFDMGSVSEVKYKWAWAPYYMEKGDEIMKSKHIEMHDALKNGTIEKWVGSSLQNSNVYNYYRSVGDIQSQFPYDVVFLEDSPQHYIEKSIIVILSVSVVILSLVCIILWRKRK